MPRYKKPGSSKNQPSAKARSVAPLLGCGLFILLVMLFMSWALSGVLNPS